MRAPLTHKIPLNTTDLLHSDMRFQWLLCILFFLLFIFWCRYNQLVHTISLFIIKHIFLNFIPAPTATLTAPNGALDRSYIHLICQATGDPEPSITWYKNGVLLTIRARAQKFPIPGGELLRLGRILKSRHEGDYTCMASNTDGTATSQTTSIKIYRG